MDSRQPREVVSGPHAASQNSILQFQSPKGVSRVSTSKSIHAPHLIRASVAAILGSAVALTALTSPAFGAEEPVVDELEEVQVTGSRISRRDYLANSPIVTVGAEVLGQTSSGSLEVNLNKLPQFNPAETPSTDAGDIQPTATNTPGAATISLRGIGANRNLVLLDGRRATPGNASMVVDLNTIPSSAIERIEIISGGASSTYGADAVGGVVNFIMKKNFQGVELNAQYGAGQQGDAGEYTIGGIMGTNFDEGRGNVSLAFSKQDRSATLRRDRFWFRKLWTDPSVAGTSFFADYSAFQPIGGVNPAASTLAGIFSAATTPVPNGTRIYFDEAGRAFTGFTSVGGNGSQGSYRFNIPAGSELQFKRTSIGTLGENFLDERLQFPLDRSNLFSRGEYEINDWLTVNAQGMFNKSTASTVQQPSPAANGWAAIIEADGRSLPTELQTILDSRVIPLTATPAQMSAWGCDAGATPGAAGSGASCDWQLTQALSFNNRTARTDVFTYNMLLGLGGRIPAINWSWDVSASEGESETNVLQTGFASLERYRTIVGAANWGEGFRSTGNAPQNGFGASTATCTSGLNPFMSFTAISDDCINAIAADVKTRSTMKQTVYEANSQGALFNLPAGPLRAALGASYRKNDYEFLNDTLSTQGRSFNDQLIGLYPSGNSQGAIDVKELYAELLVPVVADLPFVQRFDLELGARTSDYSTTGSSLTWKALVNWEVNEWMRMRGGYNKAERAPNIGELFLAPQQTFATAAGGDVCSLSNALAWSANPTANTTNAAAVRALCTTLMNNAGPGSATNFYAGTQPTGAAAVFPTTAGNPALEPEKAQTWTFGMVLNSPFESPLLSRIRVTADYYDIRVDNAIGEESVDIVQRQCFDVAFNPTLNPNSSACTRVTRNAGPGTLGNVQRSYGNNGRFQTSGVDLQASWAADVLRGTLSASTTFNYLIEMKIADLIVLPMTEYAGSLGGTTNGLNGGFYRWKAFNTVAYGLGPWNTSLQWQHLPSIRSATSPINPATTISGVRKSYNLFNLGGTYAIGDNIILRAGIDNLLDAAPPRQEVNRAPPANTLAGGAISVANYDVLGRRFYIGAKMTF
jgi:iron complex outermembrane recepter protein